VHLSLSPSLRLLPTPALPPHFAPRSPVQFESHGGTTEGVKMVQTPTMGWGLVAARDIAEGDQVKP